jgi:hypothetical protein
VGGDLERFSTRLGTADRQRIEAHLTSVRELERRLQDDSGGGGDCMPPPEPSGFDPNALDDYERTIRSHMHLMAAAAAADVTRVGVLTLSNEGAGHIHFTWFGAGFENTGSDGTGDESNSHHAIAHRGGDKKKRVDTWFHEQFAYLLDRFAAVDEGGTTMLENSTIVFANHQSTGGGHGIDDIPWILAGSCGGAFRTGRKIDAGNAMHSGILVETCHAMGVPTDDWGEPEYRVEMPTLRG